MRCSALLLAALASQAAGDISWSHTAPPRPALAAPTAAPHPANQQAPPRPAFAAPTAAPYPANQQAPALVVPVDAPDPDLFAPTTKKPFSKYVGPIVGGVLGAGALAGVIAISVLRKTTTDMPSSAYMGGPPKMSAKQASPSTAEEPETSLSTPVAKGATELQVQDQALFVLGSKFTIDQGTPVEEVNQIAAYGSLITKTPMKYAHKPGAKIAALKAPPVAAMRGAGVPPSLSAKTAGALPGAGTPEPTASSGSTESTVVIVACSLVVCGLLAICLACGLSFLMKKGKKGKKTRPTRETAMIPEDQQPLNSPAGYQPTPMNNESQYLGMESQYMPAAPPQYSVGAGLGTMPTMQNVVPMQTMPPPPMFSPPASTAYMGNGSYMGQPSYMGNQPMTASPLANTVNALPTAYNMQPPTIY